MKHKVAVMQGRLLPPAGGELQAFPAGAWPEEFDLAKCAGIDSIEWIFESKSELENPLSTDDGVRRMAALSESSGVSISSVCADYFMEKPLVRASADEISNRIGKLTWLIERCSALDVNRIVIPFVDDSSIKTSSDERTAIEALGATFPVAEACGIELHLETDLGPEDFRKFLDRLPHPFLKVNYDCGNSASLGYSHGEELDAYGDRLGSVHIKDRVRGGGSVPLGAGDADFNAVFDSLKRLDYRGNFVLQAARGEDGDEVPWVRSNRAFLERHWDNR